MLLWAFITAIIIGIRYFVDRKLKIEMASWSLRILWIGGIVAIVIGMGIFLERL
jgi:hypothetical protein